MVNTSYYFEFIKYFREVLLWPRIAHDWYILVKEVRSHPTGLQARHDLQQLLTTITLALKHSNKTFRSIDVVQYKANQTENRSELNSVVNYDMKAGYQTPTPLSQSPNNGFLPCRTKTQLLFQL